MSAGDPEDQRKREAAAAWWLRLQDDAPAELSAEFQQWIAVPANSQAFRMVETAMARLQASAASPAILAMRWSARDRFQSGNAWRRLSWRTAVAAAAALLILAGGGAYYYATRMGLQTYQTATGERRIIALADGSHISLDAASEVDVRYSKTMRAVVLTRGRARFDVAHDASRPFTVTAGTETVIAVGTSFDVELRGSKVLVTLIEGRVRIQHSSDALVAHLEAPALPISLSAGQQMVASAGRKPAIAAADLYVTQAWEAGHLVFRGAPLADAVEQVNRYTSHPIVVDASAAPIRVSGVFNAGDTQSFVSAITGYFGVDAVTAPDGTITLQKSS